jgi:methyltransferase (TIGR00027 family)
VSLTQVLHRPVRRCAAGLYLAGAALAAGTAVPAYARLGTGQALAFAAVAVVSAAVAVAVLRAARWALWLTVVFTAGQLSAVVGIGWELSAGIDEGKAGELRRLGVDPTVGVLVNLVYSALAVLLFGWVALRWRRLRRVDHRTGASFTAETVALQRAFESRRPATSRLFVDPYAEAFLRPSLRLLAAASGVAVLRRIATGLYDTVGGPGPRPSAVVRTWVIDEAVTGAAATVRQCVLLGAGYDTRAYRLPALADMPVFEIDRPATQAAKRAAVGRLGLDRRRVRYVPVDFERDDLRVRLDAAGFDASAPAVVVWEGVTNYLTAEAVDATLAVVRDLVAAGGLLVMTYVDARVLSDPRAFPEAPRWVAAVARAGEPWTFGLLPTETPVFFAARGFRLCTDVSTLDAGRARLASMHRRDRPSALYRIATAERAPTG